MGLGIGLAVSTLLLTWVQDERSYDNFHSKGKDIYEVHSHFMSGARMQNWRATQPAVAPHALGSVPGVLDAVRVTLPGICPNLKAAGRPFMKSAVAYTDPSFFHRIRFSYPERKSVPG